MIDITPYQQKLTWLHEWINDRIDGNVSPPMWVNLDAIANFNQSIEDILRIWERTGIVFFSAKDVVENPAIPISFEQFCLYKQSITN